MPIKWSGDTYREAEANTVQKTLIQRTQLCLSHYVEVQIYSEKGQAEEKEKRMEEGWWRWRREPGEAEAA